MSLHRMQLPAGARNLIIPILAAATFAVFSVTVTFELLTTLDDYFYINANDTIRSFTADHLLQAFNGFYIGNYAPLHILSYMLDYNIWGLHPAGYHLENVALHATNGILFFALLRRFNLGDFQAAAAAWIFLLHPLQVETVAWVSQRKSLLCTLFTLLTLLAYRCYSEEKTPTLFYYVASLAASVAAMLCKSIAVVIPAILVAHDLAFPRSHSHSRIKLALDKLPFAVVSLAIAFLALSGQQSESGGGNQLYPGGSPTAAVFTMTPVVAGYLRDIFWPANLSPSYLVSVRQAPDLIFAISCVPVLFLIGAGIFILRRRSHLLFWYALFTLTLLPTLQIVPHISFKNDRFLHMPLLGAAVLVTSCAQHLQISASAPLKHLLRGIIIISLLALPPLSLKQTLYWKNDVTIWTRAAELEPDNTLAWLQLTKAYTARGDQSKAIYSFNRYFELKNRFGPVRGFEEE